MSAIIILSLFSALALVAIVSSVVVTSRDGYRRVPTRSL